MMRGRIESGVELLARVAERPVVRGLCSETLLEEIERTDMIEISGADSTGKTLLLCELLGKCVLAKNSNDFDSGACSAAASAILINTDRHYSASKFTELLNRKIRDAGLETFRSLRDARAFLRNLIVYDCYNYEQFLLTLATLNNVLVSQNKVALLAIDSISAHYWQDREIHGPTSVEHHTGKILKLIRATTAQFKVPTVYTKFRPSEPFAEQSSKIPNLIYQKPNHRIYLKRVENFGNVYSCSLYGETGQRLTERYYQITRSGIKWDPLIGSDHPS